MVGAKYAYPSTSSSRLSEAQVPDSPADSFDRISAQDGVSRCSSTRRITSSRSISLRLMLTSSVAMGQATVPFRAVRTGHFYLAQSGHFHVAATVCCPMMRAM
jgi:hypothetical protein